MEPVGTTLGILGLAGLLNVCLECFYHIQDGRSLGQDFAFLEGQLSAHRLRLYAWAHACGFTQPDGRYDARLDNPVWQQHIRTQLSAIALLFLDANKILRRYVPQEGLPGQPAAAGLLADSPNAEFINDGLHRYLARIRATKKRAGLLGSLTWAVFHKRDFTRLVQQLRECVDALEMVTKNLDLFAAERHAVEVEIESIADAEVLHNMIADSHSSDGDSDIVSDAASQRILRIAGYQNSTVSGRVSSITSELSFVTAPTRHTPSFLRLAGTREESVGSSVALNNEFQENQSGPSADKRDQQIRIMELVITTAGFSPASVQPLALSDRNWGDKIAPLRAKDAKMWPSDRPVNKSSRRIHGEPFVSSVHHRRAAAEPLQGRNLPPQH